MGWHFRLVPKIHLWLPNIPSQEWVAIFLCGRSQPPLEGLFLLPIHLFMPHLDCFVCRSVTEPHYRLSSPSTLPPPMVCHAVRPLPRHTTHRRLMSGEVATLH
jgi:hypothetical protein